MSDPEKSASVAWRTGDKVFCIGLHRCGTQSLHALFEQSGLRSMHWPDTFEGQNFQSHVVGHETDLDFVVDLLTPVINAFDALSDVPFCAVFDQLGERYPNERYVALRREPEAWVRSVRRHMGGRPLDPYERCLYWRYLPNQPESLADIRDSDLIALCRQHDEDLRAFAKKRRLLIVDLVDARAGEKVCEFLGLDLRSLPHVDYLPPSAPAPALPAELQKEPVLAEGAANTLVLAPRPSPSARPGKRRAKAAVAVRAASGKAAAAIRDDARPAAGAKASTKEAQLIAELRSELARRDALIEEKEKLQAAILDEADAVENALKRALDDERTDAIAHGLARAAAEAARTQMQIGLEEWRRKAAELESRYEDLRAQAQRSSLEAVEVSAAKAGLEAELAQKELAANALASTNKALTDRVRELEAEVARLKEDLLASAEEREAERARKAGLEAELAQKELAANALGSTNKALTDRVGELEAEVARLSEDLLASAEGRQAERAQVESLQADLAERRQWIEGLEAHSRDTFEQLSEKTAALAELQAVHSRTVDEAKVQVEKLTADADAARSLFARELDEAGQTIESLSGERARLASDLAGAQAAIANAQKQIMALEVEKRAFEEMKIEHEAVRSELVRLLRRG